MTFHLLPRSLAVFALFGGLANPAFADDHADKDKGPKHESYFAISLTGGLLNPLGTMSKGTNKADSGLTIDTRLGYIGSSGLGFDFGANFTPLSRGANSSQMIGLSVAPRFTMGHGAPRLWVSLGGGVILEYDGTESTKALSINGAAGFELHFFSNGGLAVRATYARGFSGDYNLVTVTGGLVFTL